MTDQLDWILFLTGNNMRMYNFINLIVLATAILGCVSYIAIAIGYFQVSNITLISYVGGWGVAFLFLSMVMALIGLCYKIGYKL
jgi:hypothetical protein